MKSVDTHEFAFYTDSLRTIDTEFRLEIFPLEDTEVIHRIVHVLRLEKGTSIILFDAQYHMRATIATIDRRSITLRVEKIDTNKPLNPEIHWLLPLLKRDAFEEALYSLTELGATSIQPLLTQKTTRFWSGEKESVRSQKIISAAAEQSKQFSLPHLEPIISLELWLLKSQKPQTTKIFFDPAGKHLKEIVALCEKQHALIACAGPEGDLTYEEKRLLEDQGFLFCALTPTVLRAQQAVAVGLGALRSLLR